MKLHPLPVNSTLSYYTAFCHEGLGLKGNPAAVVLLENEIGKEEMQNIARDLAQPATAFLVKNNENEFGIRWFEGKLEIGLCGHGSLAAAQFLKDKGEQGIIQFIYPNGSIQIDLTGKAIEMEFDVIESKPVELKDEVSNAFSFPPIAQFTNENKEIVLFENQQAIANLQTDFSLLASLKPFGYIVTAPAENKDFDFVSRTLLPKLEMKEDQATGSSHVILTRFWSDLLGKQHLKAKQLSKQGGYFECQDCKTSIKLMGFARQL